MFSYFPLLNVQQHFSDPVSKINGTHVKFRLWLSLTCSALLAFFMQGQTGFNKSTIYVTSNSL